MRTGIVLSGENARCSPKWHVKSPVAQVLSWCASPVCWRGASSLNALGQFIPHVNDVAGFNQLAVLEGNLLGCLGGFGLNAIGHRPG
jgi:hypothetical protein